MNDIVWSFLMENIWLEVRVIFIILMAAALIGACLGSNTIVDAITENGPHYGISSRAILPILCIIVMAAYIMGYLVYKTAVIPVHRNGTYTIYEKSNYDETYSLVLKDKDGEYYKFSNIDPNTYYNHEEGDVLDCSFTEREYFFKNEKKLPECKDLELQNLAKP